MSAASVRTSGRRDSFPVLPKAAGNKGEPGSVPRPVVLRYSSRSSSNLWCTGSSFLFAAFLFKAEQKPFSRRVIVFDLQVQDGADPGESVGKNPKQSAIAQAGLRGCPDHVKKPLNFTF